MATSISVNLSILSLLLTAIGADHGTIDLTGAVQLGRFVRPPMVPFVGLDPLSIATDEAGPSLGLFERRAELFVEGWTASTVDNQVGVYAVTDAMVHAILRAVEGAHRDAAGSLKAKGVRNLFFENIEFLNTETTTKNVGHFRATLVYTYAADRGI